MWPSFVVSRRTLRKIRGGMINHHVVPPYLYHNERPLLVFMERSTEVLNSTERPPVILELYLFARNRGPNGPFTEHFLYVRPTAMPGITHNPRNTSVSLVSLFSFSDA